MAKFYYPIEIVEMREQGLASPVSATYGRVRNNNTRNHQGWDLHAPVGTHCYAIAAGVVEWIKNSGSYGQQLGIRFFKDGSAETSAVMSKPTYLAFYAHLQPGSIRVKEGQAVLAGDCIAKTGTSGNASPNSPHLHFEIRTRLEKSIGIGLQGRIDPGEILGYEVYASREVAIGTNHNGLQSFPRRGKATPVR